MIQVYAGSVARQQIKESGFTPDMFSTFLGASGGPKWFVLHGLDRFLFGEFFQDRQRTLNLVGSSAGAFRAACFAQKNSLTALDILTRRYTETVYSNFANPAEVTGKVRLLLDELFSASAVHEVLENPVFKLHMVVAKCSGLSASESRLVQAVGMLNSNRHNRQSRSLLSKSFVRYLFQSADSQLIVNDPYSIPTVRKSLDANNFVEALLASGSLPLFMQGVTDIHGCPQGIYRDGGIIDYQFDLDFGDDGLILYTHYSSSLKPGWFDKKLARTAATENYQRTVLICPSARFVESLPHQKIPDRTDFSKMDDAQRIDYWRQVVACSQLLADEFSELLEHQQFDTIRDIAELTSS